MHSIVYHTFSVVSYDGNHSWIVHTYFTGSSILFTREQHKKIKIVNYDYIKLKLKNFEQLNFYRGKMLELISNILSRFL